jgi:hypothetical protein
MKTMIMKIKKMWNSFIRTYMECMRVYGEGLLKGGSYGC